MSGWPPENLPAAAFAVLPKERFQHEGTKIPSPSLGALNMKDLRAEGALVGPRTVGTRRKRTRYLRAFVSKTFFPLPPSDRLVQRHQHVPPRLDPLQQHRALRHH